MLSPVYETDIVFYSSCLIPVFAVHDVRHLPGYLLCHQSFQLLHMAVCRYGYCWFGLAAHYQTWTQKAHQGRAPMSEKSYLQVVKTCRIELQMDENSLRSWDKWCKTLTQSEPQPVTLSASNTNMSPGFIKPFTFLWNSYCIIALVIVWMRNRTVISGWEWYLHEYTALCFWFISGVFL